MEFMKKTLSIFLIFSSIFLFSCHNAGTLEEVAKNDSIAIYKYYYARSFNKFVYVSKLSDTNVTTLTYPIGNGNYTTIIDDRKLKTKVYYNVEDVLYENDSILLIKKR